MPWLTRVYFAQFQDTGGGNHSGMIPRDGHRKAVFDAYAMSAAMPVDRVRLEGDNFTVEGLAAIDPARNFGGVLVWNGSDQVCQVQLRCGGVDWSPAVAEVRRIDATHNSPGGGTPADANGGSGDRLALPGDEWWVGDVPSRGVVFVTTEPTEGPILLPGPPPGRVVRELHDFPDRASRCYADFDRRTWTARLGMAGEDRATARVGATVDGLEDADLTAAVTGTVRPTGTVAARVDFQSRGGAYTRAVVYRLTDAGAADAPVWGTGRPAGEEVVLHDSAGLDLRHHAPADWTGRVQVSFVVADAGPDVRATFRLSGR